MQLKAKVIQTLPLVSGVSRSSGQSWIKATIIVETIEQYPKKVALNNLKRANEFVALPRDGVYTFDLSAESHEHNGRWYTELTCWNWTNA